MELKKKLKKVVLYSGALLTLMHPTVLKAKTTPKNVVTIEKDWYKDFGDTVYYFDNYSYIDYQTAKKKGFVKENPSKKELLKAVDENNKIKDEDKEYLREYIKRFCKKYPKINKFKLLNNIKGLKLVLAENNPVLGSFTFINKNMTFDKNFYNNNVSEQDNIFKKDVYIHEVGHMNQNLVINQCKKRKYLNETYSYIKPYNITFTKEVHGLGESYVEELNVYCGELLGYKDKSVYPHNIPLFKEIVDLSDEEIMKLYTTGNIDDCIKELKKVDSKLSAKKLIKLNDKQCDMLNHIPEDLEPVELGLYKQYIDYFYSKEEKENYSDYENDFATFNKCLNEVLYRDNVLSVNDMDICGYLYNKDEEAVQKGKVKRQF